MRTVVWFREKDLRSSDHAPLRDAAARQRLEEGFVRNRARMISASFLAKHPLVDYRRGEAHFMKYLTDGDVAQNNFGWQWPGGCGCDAQPYFRVLNPVTQGERFDPEGDDVRRWVPELGRMPARFIHRPWEAPEPVLRESGIRLGDDDPRPVVEHRAARVRFPSLASRRLRRRRQASADLRRIGRFMCLPPVPGPRHQRRARSLAASRASPPVRARSVSRPLTDGAFPPSGRQRAT
jgi:deoxyribodipyrimidine photolyase